MEVGFSSVGSFSTSSPGARSDSIVVPAPGLSARPSRCRLRHFRRRTGASCLGLWATFPSGPSQFSRSSPGRLANFAPSHPTARCPMRSSSRASMVDDQDKALRFSTRRARLPKEARDSRSDRTSAHRRLRREPRRFRALLEPTRTRRHVPTGDVRSGIPITRSRSATWRRKSRGSKKRGVRRSRRSHATGARDGGGVRHVRD